MENSMQRILVVVNGPLLKAGVPSVVLAIVRNLKTICTFDVILTSKDEGFYDNEFLSLGGSGLPPVFVPTSELVKTVS